MAVIKVFFLEIVHCILTGNIYSYIWWKIPGFNPTDLSKTIVFVLNFFILMKWKLINKWPLPWYDHTLYTGQRRYICYCTIWSSWNWEQGLVRPAPALCWGRATEIISKIWQVWSKHFSRIPLYQTCSQATIKTNQAIN